MVREENFPNALKEVYVILQHMDKSDVDKISKDFMKIIEENKNDDYEFFYDESIAFDKQKLMRETEAILGHIYLNYWAGADKNDDYEFFYDESIAFDKQKLMRETEAILGHIYLNYWAGADKKNAIISKLKANDALKEMAKLNKYPIDNIFGENSKKDITVESKNKENIFKKLINKIKKIFERSDSNG